MKRSNLVLSVLSFILISGIYITDNILAKQYLKINLADPYKNFDSLPVQPFKALRISGGNGFAIRIMQGSKYTIRVMHSRKSFFSKHASHDTLEIAFVVANQQYQSPDQSTVGLIITVPKIDLIELSGTNNEIGPFHQDTLVIRQDKNTVTRLKDLQVDHLQLEGSETSYFDFRQKNDVSHLMAGMQNKAYINFHQIKFRQFNPVLRDSAAIVLYSQTLDMYKQAVRASAER